MAREARLAGVVRRAPSSTRVLTSRRHHTYYPCHSEQRQQRRNEYGRRRTHLDIWVCAAGPDVQERIPRPATRYGMSKNTRGVVASPS